MFEPIQETAVDKVDVRSLNFYQPFTVEEFSKACESAAKRVGWQFREYDNGVTVKERNKK